MAERSEAGFTLVEILVAVTIVAIVLTTIYGIFTSVAGTDRRLAADSDRYQIGRVIFDRLGREIRGAYFLGRDRRTRFAGGQDRNGNPFFELSTTAVTPAGGGLGGVAVVRYVLEPDPQADREEGETEEARVLMRQETSLFDLDRDPQAGYRLAREVRAFQVRYFDGSSWREEWDADRDGLPRMVELTIVIGRQEDELPFRTVFQVPQIG